MLEGQPQTLRPLLRCSTVGDELEYLVASDVAGAAGKDVHVLKLKCCWRQGRALCQLFGGNLFPSCGGEQIQMMRKEAGAPHHGKRGCVTLGKAEGKKK